MKDEREKDGLRWSQAVANLVLHGVANSMLNEGMAGGIRLQHLPSTTLMMLSALHHHYPEYVRDALERLYEDCHESGASAEMADAVYAEVGRMLQGRANG